MTTQAVRNVEAMPFGQIIGGPISAAIEAQAMAARTTIDFIKEVGFHPPKTSGVEEEGIVDQDKDRVARDKALNESSKIAFGDVRYVTFHYQVGTSATGESDKSISVPLLALVPIPYLRIEEMNLEFTAALTDSGESSSSNTESSQQPANVSQQNWKSQNRFVGTFSANTKHTQKSKYNSQLNLGFQIKVVSEAMPAGMSKVLSIIESSMHDGEVETRVSVPEWNQDTTYKTGNIVSYKEEQYVANKNIKSSEESHDLPNSSENWQKIEPQV